jgi:hypothetical protein
MYIGMSWADVLDAVCQPERWQETYICRFEMCTFQEVYGYESCSVFIFDATKMRRDGLFCSLLSKRKGSMVERMMGIS